MAEFGVIAGELCIDVLVDVMIVMEMVLEVEAVEISGMEDANVLAVEDNVVDEMDMEVLELFLKFLTENVEESGGKGMLVAEGVQSSADACVRAAIVVVSDVGLDRPKLVLLTGPENTDADEDGGQLPDPRRPQVRDVVMGQRSRR